MKQDFGSLIQSMRRQGLAMAKSVVLKKFTQAFPGLIATPFFGPIIGQLVGWVTGKIIEVLADSAEFMAFMVNTYIRVNAQARDLEKAVDKRDQAQTEEELLKAEQDALKSFDDLAKFNR